MDTECYLFLALINAKNKDKYHHFLSVGMLSLNLKKYWNHGETLPRVGALNNPPIPPKQQDVRGIRLWETVQ